MKEGLHTVDDAPVENEAHGLPDIEDPSHNIESTTRHLHKAMSPPHPFVNS